MLLRTARPNSGHICDPCVNIFWGTEPYQTSRHTDGIVEKSHKFCDLREFAGEDLKDFVFIEWRLHKHFLFQISILADIVEDALQIFLLIGSQSVGLYESGEKFQRLFAVDTAEGADKGPHTEIRRQVLSPEVTLGNEVLDLSLRQKVMALIEKQ